VGLRGFSADPAPVKTAQSEQGLETQNS